jgi:hypothetical protein
VQRPLTQDELFRQLAAGDHDVRQLAHDARDFARAGAAWYPHWVETSSSLGFTLHDVALRHDLDQARTAAAIRRGLLAAYQSAWRDLRRERAADCRVFGK